MLLPLPLGVMVTFKSGPCPPRRWRAEPLIGRAIRGGLRQRKCGAGLGGRVGLAEPCIAHGGGEGAGIRCGLQARLVLIPIVDIDREAGGGNQHGGGERDGDRDAGAAVGWKGARRAGGSWKVRCEPVA